MAKRKSSGAKRKPTPPRNQPAGQRRQTSAAGARRLRSIRVVVAIIAALVVTAGVVMPLAISVSDDPGTGSPTPLLGP